MVTLEELKAQAAKMAEEAAAKVAESNERLAYEIDIIKAQNQIDMANNELVRLTSAKNRISAETTKKLADMNLQCQTIVSDIPIYSAKTRENRKWNPSRQYGYNNHIAELSGILSGIQYAAAEHKAHLLAITKLDADLIESTLQAFGSPAYYSRNYSTVVPETPADVATLKANLALIEYRLGLNLQLNDLTEKSVEDKFRTARVKAEHTEASSKLALDQASSGLIQM